jgi:hypothetical protein
MENNLKYLNRGDKKRLLAMSNLIIKGAFKYDNLTQAKVTCFRDMGDWVIKTPYFTYRIEEFTKLFCYDFCYKVTKTHNTNTRYKPVWRLVDPVVYERIHALGVETLIIV